MKKRWTAMLLCAAILFSMSAAVLASEDGASGFYSVGAAEYVEIVPVTSSGEAVEAVYQNVDGRNGDEQFYPGSEALRVTLTGTAPGKLYLLTVSAGETVCYADQQTGGGTITFAVAFRLPVQRTDMTLCIGSSAAGFTKITIPLSYTPYAGMEPLPEPKFGYETCPKDETCVMAAFSDLDQEAWYHDGVHFALENGLMNGMGNGRFEPNGTTSRAMIVTILWRMEGEPKSDYAMTFQDVPEGAWYTDAVRWAASWHIVDGYSAERFAPEDNVSREQLAAILWRFAGMNGLDRTSESNVDLEAFRDAEHISAWAWDAMQWAVNTGIVNGTGNDRLSPQADTSRAQAAAMLVRYVRLAAQP